MDLAFPLKGLIIGFSIAAPVGPIGLLCIQRTLSYGRLSGLVTGLGAATADGLYGAVAAFGLSAISGFLIHHSLWIRLLGGAFLLYLGIRIFFSRPATEAAHLSHRGLLSDYCSALFLTISNPMTILSFAGIFAGLGLVRRGPDFISAGLMVLGVILGSALWWLLLSWLTSLFRERIGGTLLIGINRASGAIITVLAIIALAGIAQT